MPGYAMLMGPNKAKKAVRGYYFMGSLVMCLTFL